jgi:Domain of unknown function (DUF4145)
MEQGGIVKAHCDGCSGERNHHVVHAYEEKWSDEVADDTFVSGSDHYELLKCAGCNSIRLRHTNWFSENAGDEGRAIPAVTYYPPASVRRKPSWLGGVDLSGGSNVHLIWMPDFVSRLLGEVYVALQNDCCSLAAMGIRALLEQVMIDHVKDQGTFGRNLSAFERAGHIGSAQKETIETTLEVGHASIHRNFIPTHKDMMQVLDIAENVVQSIYVSGEQAKDLKKRIPPREHQG